MIHILKELAIYSFVFETSI